MDRHETHSSEAVSGGGRTETPASREQARPARTVGCLAPVPPRQSIQRRILKTRSSTPGICRIDQASRRTHGFFVRIQRKGKIHSAFFSDLAHGGRKAALAAAQGYHQEMQSKLGPPPHVYRRAWAQIRRRQSASGIIGVRKVLRVRKGKAYDYWMASWSPEPHVVQRMSFSIAKYGAREAKQLAVMARRRGVQEMV